MLNSLVASRPPCTIGVEACSVAHHSVRQFQADDHTVLLTVPKRVAPCRMSGKRGKHGAADAAVICEAVQRPGMRFVPVKPAVNRRCATRPWARSTFVAGSSMGGLISVYALCKYPQVFCGVAGLSTHWVGSPPPGGRNVCASAVTPPPMP